MKEKDLGKSAVVFCSKGLGDGLLFLTVAHNLYINGYRPVVYHDSLVEMQSWFPEVTFYKYPQSVDSVKDNVFSADIVIVNKDDRTISEQISRFVKKESKPSAYILMPTTCKGKNLPGDFHFDASKSMVKNLMFFCQNMLNLLKITSQNGIYPPLALQYRKNAKRVIIHSSAMSNLRIWPLKKMFKLAKKIQLLGYDPLFCFSMREGANAKAFLSKGYQTLVTRNLYELAEVLYESGFFIGNDSGVGHLASCLKIPTLTICSSKRKKLLWRPDWFENRTVIPYSVIPNFKLLRLRGRLWKYFIEVWRVFYHFKKLVKEGKK